MDNRSQISCKPNLRNTFFTFLVIQAIIGLVIDGVNQRINAIGTLRCAVNKSNSRGSWVRGANATSVQCRPPSLKYPVAVTISFDVVRHLNLFLSMDFDKLRPNLFVQVRMILGRSNKNFFSHNTLSFTHEHWHPLNTIPGIAHQFVAHVVP